MDEPTEKKILVLETAERLFSAMGYENTSIRDIAKAGSFNSSMISYYFGSKEKLLQSIIRYRTIRQDEQIQSLLQRGGPVEQIFTLMDFYIREACERRAFFLLMLQIQAFPGKYRLVKAHAASLQQKNFLLFHNIITDGQINGLFKPDVDTAMLMFIIFGTVSNAVLYEEYYKKTKANLGSTLRILISSFVLREQS